MAAANKKSDSKTSNESSTDGPKPAAKKPTPTKPDEMSGEVIEFITAIDDYKRIHQRPFPTWSEVLDILKELGYSRTG